METSAIGPFLILDALTGIILIVVGFILLRYPPKEINSLYGYRTEKSMKSQEAWDFAQIFSSKLMIKAGVFLSLVGLLGYVLLEVSFLLEVILASIAFTLGLCALFYYTESELDKFPKN